MNSPAEAPQPPRAATHRRKLLLWLGAGAVAVGGGAALVSYLGRFPPDTTPEGAYMRITYNLARNNVTMVFPYLEDRAQHACFTVVEFRRRAYERVFASYPEPERTPLLQRYQKHAHAGDGSEVWVDLAQQRGFIQRLRQDLSGIAQVEVDADRATIQTARGTRYPFRRRANGIWGLTLFTAALLEEADRAARDFQVIDRAASDYDRAD